MPRGRTAPPRPPAAPWSALVRELGYDPSPVATAAYAEPPRAVEVALAACLGHPSLCVRLIPEASAWLLRDDMVATRVEGADFVGFVFTHLEHDQLMVVVVEAEGEGARARVYTLHPLLRAQVAQIWEGLAAGVAAALGKEETDGD